MAELIAIERSESLHTLYPQGMGEKPTEWFVKLAVL